MKVLVFAHTPPPLHGQSYMVQLMLDGFGGDRRKAAAHRVKANGESAGPGKGFDIECYHVNARLSHNLEDIGDVRLGKFILLLGYCLRAIWCRFRYGVINFYYVPAPGKSSAIYRDWMVMLICRPFFKRVFLHWHAAGLARWLETVVQMRFRAMTYQLCKPVDLSIVLSEYSRADGEKLLSRHVKVVANGIPDPCPRFEQDVLPRRKARFIARKELLSGGKLDARSLEPTGGDPQVLKVLFLAHCTRDKGLFDAMDAIENANRRLLAAQSSVRFHLTVAGNFIDPKEEREFQQRLAQSQRTPGGAGWLAYAGFVFGEQKERLLTESDCFCFPTYYYAESFGVVLVEAMAFGLPILTTRWRSIPELLPPDYPWLVDVRSPQQISERLLPLLTSETGEGFRNIFLKKFTVERHLSALADAFHAAEQPERVPVASNSVPVPG